MEQGQCAHTKQLQMDKGPGPSQPRGRQSSSHDKGTRAQREWGPSQIWPLVLPCLLWMGKQTHHWWSQTPDVFSMVAPEVEDWEAQAHTPATSSGKKSPQGKHGSVQNGPLKAHRQKTRLTVDREEVLCVVVQFWGGRGQGRGMAASSSPAWATRQVSGQFSFRVT